MKAQSLPQQISSDLLRRKVGEEGFEVQDLPGLLRLWDEHASEAGELNVDGGKVKVNWVFAFEGRKAFVSPELDGVVLDWRVQQLICRILREELQREGWQFRGCFFEKETPERVLQVASLPPSKSSKLLEMGKGLYIFESEIGGV